MMRALAFLVCCACVTDNEVPGQRPSGPDFGPCDEVLEPQAGGGIARGVAGAVIQRSDACADDCCTYSMASLGRWTSDGPINAGVAFRLLEEQPVELLEVSGEYARELPEGHHLLCANRICALLDIGPSSLFTVNVQQIFGPTQLFVISPGEDEPRSDLVFDLSRK